MMEEGAMYVCIAGRICVATFFAVLTIAAATVVLEATSAPLAIGEAGALRGPSPYGATQTVAHAGR